MASLKIQRFDGGLTTISSKVGLNNSARKIKALDIFDDPAHITLAKQTTKISSTTVTGLPFFFADGSPWNTNRYAYDSAGKIYQITSADSVSSLRTVSGGGGEGLVVHNNGLYYALATNIGRYYPLNNSPSFNDDLTSWHDITNVQQSGGGTGATDYVPPTSISEAATARQTILSIEHDPVVSIVIDVDVVGTGDWTVTVHDRNNRVVGSKTIANGSMSTGDITFTFDSVLRVETGEDYHFHVTSTVADGGVDTDSATDLEGAEFTVNFGVLINADFHQMVNFFGGFAIANERYIAFFDKLGGTYSPTQIKLDPGFVVRTMYVVEEYLVVEAWKGQSFSETEESKRYFWDGIESSYNFVEPIEAPNAAFSYRNSLVGIYGNKGAIYEGSKPQTKITEKVPGLSEEKSVEVYPGAIAEYRERLIIGYSGVTDSATLDQGVYEYGSQSSQQSNVLSFPYIISTGTTQGTTLKIGGLGSFGTDLYIGSRDASNYQIDKVSLTSESTDEVGEWRSRWFDNGDPEKTKQAIKLEIVFEALASGQSITPVYEINRSGTEISGTAETTVGETKALLFINSQYREISFGFDMSSSGSTFPKVLGINFLYQGLEDEDDES